MFLDFQYFYIVLLISSFIRLSLENMQVVFALKIQTFKKVLASPYLVQLCEGVSILQVFLLCSCISGPVAGAGNKPSRQHTALVVLRALE